MIRKCFGYFFISLNCSRSLLFIIEPTKSWKVFRSTIVSSMR